MNEIKTVKFNGPLYRANKNIFNKGKITYKANAKKNTLASNNYRNAPLKYFTLKRENTEPYSSEGTSYIKNWNVTSTLKLVNILDLNTRKAVEAKFNKDEKFKKAIEQAFPIINSKVRRISSSIDEDNTVLVKICELGYDGYYMDVEGKNIGFHSEVGLCKNAFDKLKLSNNSKRKFVPEKTRKRSRAEFEANKNLSDKNSSNNNQNYRNYYVRRKAKFRLNSMPKLSFN